MRVGNNKWIETMKIFSKNRLPLKTRRQDDGPLFLPLLNIDLSECLGVRLSTVRLFFLHVVCDTLIVS